MRNGKQLTVVLYCDETDDDNLLSLSHRPSGPRPTQGDDNGVTSAIVRQTCRESDEPIVNRLDQLLQEIPINFDVLYGLLTRLEIMESAHNLHQLETEPTLQAVASPHVDVDNLMECMSARVGHVYRQTTKQQSTTLENNLRLDYEHLLISEPPARLNNSLKTIKFENPVYQLLSTRGSFSHVNNTAQQMCPTLQALPTSQTMTLNDQSLLYGSSGKFTMRPELAPIDPPRKRCQCSVIDVTDSTNEEGHNRLRRNQIRRSTKGTAPC